MRRMISTLLTDEGYEVRTAVDGNDGLVKVAEEPRPELVLSDFEMPELDGPGFCRAVKANKDLRTIPVLMLTTLEASESKVTGLDSGADDYIAKPKNPGDIQELFARIRAHFRIADLRRELDERNRALEAAHKKLHLELELARKVQFALMPRPPKARGGIKSAVKYKPANQLGGDMYDFYRLENNRIGILVADVSGHGVNSAMLSGMVKALAAGLSITAMEPGELLAGLDVSLEQYFPEGYFCTGFYLIVDEETGLVRYSGVGHPPAIVVGPGGVRTLQSNPGLLGVGMVDGTDAQSDRLAPGESLFVYTDGLPDAMDPNDVMFGEERIKSVLQAHHTEEPSVMLDKIEEAMMKHVHPGAAADDISFVLIQHKA